MKKIISAFLGIVLITSISFEKACGQDVAASTNTFSHNNNLQGSKVVTNNGVASLATSVNKRAIKDFAKNYSGNIQPVWSLMESGGYTASFVDTDIQNCVYYDKGGNWMCNIKRYDESKMSPELRQIIKPVYYDYTITGIAEIIVPGNTVHLVYLTQNATSFKTVRVCNGEMEVIEWIKDNKILNL